MLKPKIKIGVSLCLLGERVRYNGGHKFDRLISDVFASALDLLPICPEVEIGMGVPRPPIHLVRDGKEVKAVSVDSEIKDFTGSLQSLAKARKHQLSLLSGYVFKAKSPSCGLTDVPIIDSQKNNVMKFGSGIFAKGVRDLVPALPVEDEMRLNDWNVFHNFMERVHIFNDWLTLDKRNDQLRAEFHRNACVHVLARGQDYVEVFNGMYPKKQSQFSLTNNCDYIVWLMQILCELPSRLGHARAMKYEVSTDEHQLSSDEKDMAFREIDLYENSKIELNQLLVKFCENSWFEKQSSSYLNPYPRKLLLAAGQYFNDQPDKRMVLSATPPTRTIPNKTPTSSRSE